MPAPPEGWQRPATVYGATPCLAREPQCGGQPPCDEALVSSQRRLRPISSAPEPRACVVAVRGRETMSGRFQCSMQTTGMTKWSRACGDA